MNMDAAEQNAEASIGIASQGHHECLISCVAGLNSSAAVANRPKQSMMMQVKLKRKVGP